jgi:ABC-2 type transport system permease protein
MLIVLVKNNFKLMIRSKISILMLIVLPILLIALLSSAFSKDLNKNYTINTFTVGYSIESGSKIENSFKGFIKNFQDNNIILLEMEKEKAIEEVKNEGLTAFIHIKDDKYTIYKRDGFDVNTIIFENSMSTAMYLYDGNKTLMSYLTEKGFTGKTDNVTATGNKSFVNLEILKIDPFPTSTVYYGIAEIVYVIWFGMMAVSTMVSNERKYGVTDRIGLTNASSLTLFLGKLIPSVLTVFVQIGIATIVSTVLMKVNWGNSPLLSAGIIILEIIAASALGIVMAIIIKSPALVNVIIFLSSYFFGFVGGSFQTYMYNFVSDNIAKLSPIYYINRTLVELSTKGYSNYTNSCIIILLAIITLAIIIGAVATDRGRKAI